jgi:hypothetical protein
MTLFGYKIELTTSVIFLIAMNAIPVFGVFAFVWDVGTLLLLYWLESVVIGLLNVPKMLACQASDSQNSFRRSTGGVIYLCVFFLFHYGGFSFGHYLFLDSLFASVPPLTGLISDILSAQGLLISMVGLWVSHIFSMFKNFYGKGEYKTRSANKQMFVPYGRVFIMHIVIIIGGTLVQAFGAPVLALILLVVLKTAIDLVAHSLEHQNREPLIRQDI